MQYAVKKYEQLRLYKMHIISVSTTHYVYLFSVYLFILM